MAAFFVVVTASAQTPLRGPRLVYATIPGCPDEATFRDEVATMLGGIDHFRTDAPDVVRVSFSKVPGGYRGTVEYTPAKGETWPAEHKTGGHCLLLAQAVAVIASLRIPDPPATPAVTAPPEPTATPTATPTAPPAPTVTAVPTNPIPSPPPRSPGPPDDAPFVPPPPPLPQMDLTITLSTALLMTAGFSADVGPALQIGGGIRRDWFSLDLELRGVFPARAVASDQLNAAIPREPREFDLSQLSAQLVPCVRFATYLAGCGVIGVYALITQDRTQGTDFYPGWSVGPRFRAEYPFAERFAVFGFGEALFTPYQQGVAYETLPGQPDTPGISWRLSIVSGFFGVGASVNFQ
ncbi:MAG: hypothetical protein IPK82_24095 [Polyangiaceae bacterium]|nr:hypothetical protein [Polyangiaceae bacterium]